MFRKKYRVVIDSYAGYEVQHKYWFLPFWFQTGGVNTFATLEAAKKYITKNKRPVVYSE